MNATYHKTRAQGTFIKVDPIPQEAKGTIFIQFKDDEIIQTPIVENIELYGLDDDREVLKTWIEL